MSSELVVFVVDDDEAARDSLQALFEAHGLQTEVFASARDFLDRCADSVAGCLVTDIRMPGMDGLELVIALRQRSIGIPVIVITGHGDVHLAVKAMKSGASDFIEKPFEESVIVGAVREAVEVASGASDDLRSAAQAAERVGRLTPRERDVLEQLIIGHPNKVIAHALGISPRTVEIHRARLMEKMQARSLSHLVRIGIAAGLQADRDPPK